MDMKKILKKGNGFTLIEILAVIVILGILFTIGIGAYSSHVARTRKKAIEAETKKLTDASYLFFRQYQRSAGFKETVYTDASGVKVKESCISVKSLIEKGFYNDTVKFLNKDIDKDNSVIKVTDTNGKVNYELLTDSGKINQDCHYLASKESENVTVDPINEMDVKLNTNIRPDAVDKDKYLVTLDFSSEIWKLKNYNVPVYVMEVFDTSGSMGYKDCSTCDTRYNYAKPAALKLSEDIIKNFDESYVGLINFADPSVVKVEFQHKSLVSSDFNNPSGDTGILIALDQAYERMKDLKADENGIEPIKYAIVLSDGQPEDHYHTFTDCKYSAPKVTDACIDYIKNSAKRFKDKGINLVILSYGMYLNDRLKFYEDVASTDPGGKYCPGSSIKNRCYYESNATNIAGIFDKLSSSIQKSVNDSQIAKSVINVKFTDSIELYYSNGERVKENAIELNTNLNDNNVNEKHEYLIKFVGDWNAQKCDPSKKDECEINLFKEYTLVLQDSTGKTIKTLSPDSIPNFTIKRQIVSIIN